MNKNRYLHQMIFSTNHSATRILSIIQFITTLQLRGIHQPTSQVNIDDIISVSDLAGLSERHF